MIVIQFTQNKFALPMPKDIVYIIKDMVSYAYIKFIFESNLIIANEIISFILNIQSKIQNNSFKKSLNFAHIHKF